MGSTSYTTGLIRPHSIVVPFVMQYHKHAAPLHREDDTTCRRLRTAHVVRSFSPAPHRRKPACAGADVSGPAGHGKYQAHRPATPPTTYPQKSPKPKGSNRTEPYATASYSSDYQSKAFPVPKRFASNISTPFAVLPLAHSCAAAAPGTVLRTNTAPDFFQLQPIRPEPPHETPQSSHPFLRLFTSVQIRECSVFALTWSQWAAIMTAFPVPLA